MQLKKTSLFRRLSSFLTATALAVTSCLTFVPQLSASAITDGNLSMVEDVAHLDYTTTLANGYEGDYFKEHGLNPNYLTVDGKEVFCIQPFTFFGDMHSDSLNYVTGTGTNDCWNGRSYTDKKGVNIALTPEKRAAIGLILYYGYYNGNSSHQTSAYRLATQLLIWEVSGFNKTYTANNTTVRNPSSFNINSGKKSTLSEVVLQANAGCTMQQLTAAYNQILSDIRNRNALGSMSYNSESYARNNAKDLKWNTATNRYEYTFTLSSSDAALWEDLGWTQKINSDSLLEVSKSGNNYTVYTTTPFFNTKTFSSTKSSTNARMYRGATGITIFNEKSQPNERQVVAMGGTPQPVTGYMGFKVTEIRGEITIQKEFKLSDATEAPDSFYEQPKMCAT